MQIFNDFDKEALLDIAKNSGNKQIVKDVNYTAFLLFHNAKNIYVERVDGAFIIGQFQKQRFRIIGLCTRLDKRGLGLAKFLLQRAENKAREQGLSIIRTVSLSGADFYVKQGYDVVAMKHGDYVLEKTIKQ